MAFATVDVAKQFSNESFVAKMRSGVISKLTKRLPQVMIGDTEYFDLSGRTKGELVGEAAAKSPTPTAHPLRHIKTVKLQYTERFSREFLQFNDEKKLGIINQLAEKWMGSDFQADLDTIVIHGVNPLSGKPSMVVSDYITKTNSCILVPSTGTTGTAINTDLTTAITAVADGFGANGVAFSNTAAAALAGLKTSASVPMYPSLGSFGLDVKSFEGLPAASSKEVGEYGGVQAIIGDWDALRWGIASEFPVELIEYGDPDGQGDLQRYNQIALRYEVIFGFGIANPDALAVIMTPPSTKD